MASGADSPLDRPRRRTGSPARQELQQLLQAAFHRASARQTASSQTPQTPFARRPTRPRQTRTGLDPRRAMPGRRALPADGLPTLRRTPERRRSRTPAASGLGTARNPSPSSPNTNDTDSSVPAAAPPAATCPPGVPTGQAGPRLIAFSGLLMACFRQSKRRAAQFLGMILNQPASSGWMVALQNRAAEAVRAGLRRTGRTTGRPARSAHRRVADQGRPRPRPGSGPSSPRPSPSSPAAPVAAAEVATQLLGAAFAGVVHCDRARMYWAFGRLQWCWAHLKRDFQASDRQPLPHQAVASAAI